MSAVNLPALRILDRVVDKNDYLEESWKRWFTALANFLSAYFDGAGFHPPQFTLAEQALLVNVPPYTMMIVTDAPAGQQLQIYIGGSWHYIPFV